MGNENAKNRGAGWRVATATLLVLICGVRLIGGLAMVLRGAAVSDEVLAGDFSVRALGLLMLVIASVGVWAGIGLFSRPDRWWRLGAWATAVLWADGVLNGFVLFGAPRVGGQVLNAGVATVLLVGLVLVGRRSRAEAAPEEA